MLLADVGDGLPVSLDDLEVPIVHPHPALEIALLADNLFGRDVEDVAVQIVFLLLAHVEQVVLRQFLRGQHERQPMPDVVKVLLRHEDLGQVGLGRKHHVLDAPSLVVKEDVEHLMVLAVIFRRGHRDRLPVGVLIAGLLEFLFLGRKPLDDFFRRSVFRRRVLEGALLGKGRQRYDNEEEQGKNGRTQRQLHIL